MSVKRILLLQLKGVSLLLCLMACNNSLDNGVEISKEYSGNEPYTIRETRSSVSGVHHISTFVTNRSGMGIELDGEKKYYDDIAIRYKPVVGNNGKYAYAQQLKGSGYDIIWEGKSVKKSSSCLDFLTGGADKAVFVESEMGRDKVSRVYLLDLMTGGVSNVANWADLYIDSVCEYSANQFGIIVCQFDSNGTKSYSLYVLDGISGNVLEELSGETDVIAFPRKVSENEKRSLQVDFLRMSGNDRLLYNALQVVGGGKDAFSFGNDFRGRMSWDESERLRGLVELHRKTHVDAIRNRITNVVDGIMNARNEFTEIVSDEWNPEFLWASKCYTLNGEAACIMAENCEILSSLLLVCNEGLVKNSEIVKVAKQAYEYYDAWYKDGHYYQPKGYPAELDGIVVPWNYQNSLAEVCLGLWIETREQKYLDRCNEQIMTFMGEWVENGDRIYWHYWPMAFYDGWKDDGRSLHIPSRAPQDDKLFEDASHAGISVRLLKRYVDNVKNGVVNESHIRKIEQNMKYFCHQDGFSRFISGDENYNARGWSYWISPYFAYLENADFELYVQQGYLGCFPEWDSEESLFAYSRLYKPELNTGVTIQRKRLNEKGELESVMSSTMTADDLWDYLNLGESF